MNETIHNESIPVTADMVFAALKAAKAEGNQRRDEYALKNKGAHVLLVMNTTTKILFVGIA